MELLEGQDPVKKKLIETSDRHKHELQREVKELTDKSQRVLKNALIIGGALAIGYMIFSQVSSSRRKKKHIKEGADMDHEPEIEDHRPSLMATVGTQVMSQATLMLLEIAKEKLSEYLQSRRDRGTTTGQE